MSRDWKYDEVEQHAEALRDFLENETSLGMRGGPDGLYQVRQAMRFFGNKERARGIGHIERARVASKHVGFVETEVDEVICTRQREWRRWFRWFNLNNLKLRDLVTAAVTPYVAKLEREIEALRAFAVDRMGAGGLDPDLSGYYRQIDEEEVAP